MTAVLFVCLGNICRSPTAEGVFRDLAQKAGLTVEVDSCGTGDWHAGEPPYPAAVAAALRRGYDISDQRARKILAEDFTRFDHVLAMDKRNMAKLLPLCQKGGATPRLFLDYAPQIGTDEVPDPWYTGQFDLVLDMVEAASLGLISAIQSQGRR